jgi:HlyD family secretion protein
MKLIPGMTANVSIITSKKENAKSVPNEALKFTPNVDGSGPKYKEQGIWILGENKKPKRIAIKTGAGNDTYTEIITEEINTGDKVIVGLNGSDSKKRSGAKPPMRMF